MKMRNFLALALTALLGSCTPGNTPPDSSAPLTAPEAQKWLAAIPNAQLIDVRTPGEYAEGRLKGSKLIPLQELEERAGEIRKKDPVLLYCRSGRRSQQAQEILEAKGYKDLRQIAGGILAWEEAGLPVEKD